MTLEALAVRCESAGRDQQGKLIEEAWWAVNPNYADGRRLRELLDVGAFESAAMLLAQGFGGQVSFFKDGTAKAFLWQPYPLAVETKAATPALALTAATLRAHLLAQKDEVA